MNFLPTCVADDHLAMMEQSRNYRNLSEKN